jgi:hypothetical protein
VKNEKAAAAAHAHDSNIRIGSPEVIIPPGIVSRLTVKMQSIFDIRPRTQLYEKDSPVSKKSFTEYRERKNEPL